MKRRILSSLMALVLVFGLLPATAFAEGEAASTAKTIYVDAINGDDTQETASVRQQIRLTRALARR